jgi:hypothetical protein
LTGHGAIAYKARMSLACFACGAIESIAPGGRVGFRDVCARCSVDLHVCRNCANHDTGAQNQCREPQAEFVSERERANRCDWFRPHSGAGGSGTGERDRARGALEGLFGKKK